MTRRSGFTLLAIAIAVFFCCAALIGYRLLRRHAAPVPPVVAVAPRTPEIVAPTAGPISTMIDLPGDPVLVRRGATVAPRSLSVDLPASLGAAAPKAQSAAFFVSGPLVSSDGGFMGKFPEAAEGADVADAALLSDGGQVTVDAGAAADAGFDDDGGASTPVAATPQAGIADLNSSQLDVSIGGANAEPQIKEAIIKVVVQERISDLLIRNGFAEDSARAIEAAAKAIYNVQSLPPASLAIAEGALDMSGAYRVTQLSVYENKEYVGAVALGEGSGYGEGAQPAIPPGLLDEGSMQADLGVRYDLADGLYSAGVRNNVPEPVIREAIQLLEKLTNLKTPVAPEENFRVLYARDFRGKSKSSGKVIYIGLTGPTGPIDCYSFQSADGGFRCFNPKAGGGGPAPSSVGGIFEPIKGAPVTSTFGMRFHPILHILRLHAGIDFGAPIGSVVRSVADGKVEIAGPVSGFGNHVRIQHKGFETSYSHLSEIPANIVPGATVTEGETIGLSGNTGLSTGPHLHFEYYVDRVAVDPLPHMGTEVAGVGAAPPSDQETAAFAADKALVDAALESAGH